jgi:hypothetical protein
MSLAVPELIERKHRLEAENVAFEKEIAKRQTELATIDRVIESEVLRLAGEGSKEKKTVNDVKDLIGIYKGQKKRILKAIWNAPKRRLSITGISMIEWRTETTPHSTLERAIRRINERLRNDGCAYTLKPIKSRVSKEIKGYGVRRDSGQNGQK